MKEKAITLPYIIFLVFFLVASCRKDDDLQLDQNFRFYEKITVDGRERTYLLNLPPNYYESSDFSLVIAMHGGGGEAGQFESTSLLTEKANASKFIVVYPEGVQSNKLLKLRTWNAGKCCDYAVEENIDDVNFISTLIDKLVNTYKVNPKKVYATGHSNGGMLSYRLACEIPGKIAAIATSGCTMVVKQSCNPTRAVPVLHMHSVLDDRVPYMGGVGVTDVYYPSVDSILNVWSNNNSCSVKAKVLVDDNKYKFAQWTDCANNTTIDYYLTKDGGHAWPGGLAGSQRGDTPSKVISANDLLWEFFQKYQSP